MSESTDIEQTEAIAETPEVKTTEPVKTEPKEAETAEPKPERTKSLKSTLREHLAKSSEPKEVSKPEALKPVQSATSDPRSTEAIAPKAPVSNPILAPADMTPEEKAAFNSSPALQQYLSRRAYQLRTEFQKQTQALQQKSREIESISQAIEPYRETLIRQGIQPDVAIRRAIAWDQGMQTRDYGSKIQTARAWLDSYGVDPAELLDAESGQQSQQNGHLKAPDTNGYLTKEQFDALMEERENQNYQKLYVQSATEAVDKWKGSKPLFKDPGTAEQLEAEMAPIVEALRVSSPSKPHDEILETAYQYVTKGNPRFSELVQRLEARPLAEKTKADAIKAQNASRSISGGPGSGIPTRKFKSIGENLRARLNDTV